MSLYNAHFNSFKMFKNKSIINPIGKIILLEKNVSFKWKGRRHLYIELKDLMEKKSKKVKIVKVILNKIFN